jgi:hypothetical protein
VARARLTSKAYSPKTPQSAQLGWLFNSLSY